MKTACDNQMFYRLHDSDCFQLIRVAQAFIDESDQEDLDHKLVYTAEGCKTIPHSESISMELVGATLTMVQTKPYTFEYPLAVTFQSHDQYNKCVTFEIRSQVVGSGKENISIVN